MIAMSLRNFLLGAAAVVAAAATGSAQDLLAVKGGKIVPIQGPVIEDGVLLIENGRITKIAKTGELEIPWAAKVIDASGKWVLPTWVVAHSQGGQRGFNESMQNVPWLSVADAIDPSAPYFEDMLRTGVGTIHVLAGNQTLLGGFGMVVRPFGRTVEDMTVAGNTGIKMSLFAAAAAGCNRSGACAEPSPTRASCSPTSSGARPSSTRRRPRARSRPTRPGPRRSTARRRAWST